MPQQETDGGSKKSPLRGFSGSRSSSNASPRTSINLPAVIHHERTVAASAFPDSAKQSTIPFTDRPPYRTAQIVARNTWRTQEKMRTSCACLAVTIGSTGWEGESLEDSTQALLAEVRHGGGAQHWVHPIGRPGLQQQLEHPSGFGACAAGDGTEYCTPGAHMSASDPWVGADASRRNTSFDGKQSMLYRQQQHRDPQQATTSTQKNNNTTTTAAGNGTTTFHRWRAGRGDSDEYENARPNTYPRVLQRIFCWRRLQGLAAIPHKSLEKVGALLQQRYERIRKQFAIKTCLNPTPEDLKEALRALRSTAGQEVVLFHSYSHCVIRPEKNLMFLLRKDSPVAFSVEDLLQFIGLPSFFIFDCAGAGSVLAHCLSTMKRAEDASQQRYRSHDTFPTGFDFRQHFLFMGACRDVDAAPSHPLLPNDVFTSCLTTPIAMSVLWFLIQHRQFADIPLYLVHGLDEQSSPIVAELKKIFVAIVDSIAWSICTPDLFYRLFREDHVVVTLFRNYILAERIIASLGCTPVSFPVIASSASHALWDTWDCAVDVFVCSMLRTVKPPPTKSLSLGELRGMLEEGDHRKASILAAINDTKPSFTFFDEELQSFQILVKELQYRKERPLVQKLPILMNACCARAPRQRGLVLVCHLVDQGAWAVDQCDQVRMYTECLNRLWTSTGFTKEIRELSIFATVKSIYVDPMLVPKKVQQEALPHLLTVLREDISTVTDSKLLGPYSSPAGQKLLAVCCLCIMLHSNREMVEDCVRQGEVMMMCAELLSTAFESLDYTATASTTVTPHSTVANTPIAPQRSPTSGYDSSAAGRPTVAASASAEDLFAKSTTSVTRGGPQKTPPAAAHTMLLGTSREKTIRSNLLCVVCAVACTLMTGGERAVLEAAESLCQPHSMRQLSHASPAVRFAICRTLHTLLTSPALPIEIGDRIVLTIAEYFRREANLDVRKEMLCVFRTFCFMRQQMMKGVPPEDLEKVLKSGVTGSSGKQQVPPPLTSPPMQPVLSPDTGGFFAGLSQTWPSPGEGGDTADPSTEQSPISSPQASPFPPPPHPVLTPTITPGDRRVSSSALSDGPRPVLLDPIQLAPSTTPSQNQSSPSAGLTSPSTLSHLSTSMIVGLRCLQLAASSSADVHHYIRATAQKVLHELVQRSLIPRSVMMAFASSCVPSEGATPKPGSIVEKIGQFMFRKPAGPSSSLKNTSASLFLMDAFDPSDELSDIQLSDVAVDDINTNTDFIYHTLSFLSDPVLTPPVTEDPRFLKNRQAACNVETYVNKVSQQLGKLATVQHEACKKTQMRQRWNFDFDAKVILFHPTDPYVICAGNHDGINVYLMEEKEAKVLPVSSFNVSTFKPGAIGGPPGQAGMPLTPKTPSSSRTFSHPSTSVGAAGAGEKGSTSFALRAPITSLQLLDPAQSPLLLAAGADGGACIFSNIVSPDSTQSVSAFRTLSPEVAIYSHVCNTAYQQHVQRVDFTGYMGSFSSWDLLTEQLLDERRDMNVPATAISADMYSPSCLAVGYAQGGILLYDLRQRTPIARLEELKGSCLSISYNRYGPNFITAGSTVGLVVSWDVRKLHNASSMPHQSTYWGPSSTEDLSCLNEVLTGGSCSSSPPSFNAAANPGSGDLHHQQRHGGAAASSGENPLSGGISHSIDSFSISAGSMFNKRQTSAAQANYTMNCFSSIEIHNCSSNPQYPFILCSTSTRCRVLHRSTALKKLNYRSQVNGFAWHPLKINCAVSAGGKVTILDLPIEGSGGEET